MLCPSLTKMLLIKGNPVFYAIFTVVVTDVFNPFYIQYEMIVWKHLKLWSPGQCIMMLPGKRQSTKKWEFHFQFRREQQESTKKAWKILSVQKNSEYRMQSSLRTEKKSLRLHRLENGAEAIHNFPVWMKLYNPLLKNSLGKMINTRFKFCMEAWGKTQTS